MYKVAIVDDDRIIRRGLAQVVPWRENGFQLVGDASDGERGLELIEKHKPQIVVSDIKMPFMGGLEMARIIKEKTPNIKFIFLTGYEDFQYAHEAIRIKAFDYLLKPVETENLILKLKQAAEEWENENQKDKIMKESSPFFEKRFLEKLKTRTFHSEELKRELNSFGIQLDGVKFTSILIKFDHEILEAGAGLDQLKEEIGRHCLTVFKESGFLWGILHAEGNGDLAIFLSSNISNYLEMEQTVKASVSKLLKIVADNLGTTLTITTGSIYPELSGIRLSYLEADSAMGYRHIMGKNTVYSINETKQYILPATLDFDIAYEEIINSIKMGLASKIEEYIEKTKNRILKCRQISLQDIQLIAIRMVGLMFHESAKWAKNWQDLKQLSQYEAEILNMQTIHEIFEQVENIAVNLALFMNQQNDKKKISLVDKAIEYIEKNYHLENLSLQKIAEEIHVNSAYLSNLFKVEKGFNFGDFLLETRMKAAMELFRQTDLKTYEIALKTGYSNPQYFSICFKKYTGYSPIQFKKLK